MKSKVPEHIVIVDTNILWHDNKEYVVDPDFDHFWTKEKVEFPMKLHIPEVVIGELLFQQTTSAQNALRKANDEIGRISKVTGQRYSEVVSNQKIRKQVEARMNSWVNGVGAVVLTTPIKTINWAEVLENAIWRIEPFTKNPKEPKHEKGFRDAMILETVSSATYQNLSQNSIAFICEDHALRSATDQRLGANKNFSTYECLSDFVSFISLTKENLTKEFVKSIMARARDKFYNLKDKESLFYRDRFYEKLSAESQVKIDAIHQGNALSSLSSRYRWTPVSEMTCWVSNPQFNQVEDGRIYHWTSRVTFYRLFTRRIIPSFAESISNISSGGDNSEQRVVELGIDVHWKARVSSDGRFLNTEIISYEEGCHTFLPATDELLSFCRLES